MAKLLHVVAAPLLASSLLLTPVTQAGTASPATGPQVEALIGELLNNVDWQLLMKLQQNILANLDLLVPYTEEYIACLEAEGTLDNSQPLDLKRLIGAAKNASATCNVILESLAGKLDFNLTEEELNNGLSPEYRDLLKKSL
ncbi:hypothetical protein [Motiliproteus sediminis]|uniref:hypothetical protein n=1 Tax=Motiliproteus sediminis TaxID=1468178 RepID=UPI001AEFAF4A|nr:hypothetical protein [Motiliproteus sediminis]